jgi:hypothetical protein
MTPKLQNLTRTTCLNMGNPLNGMCANFRLSQQRGSPHLTVPVTVPASFKTQPIPPNATQNEGRTISTNYPPFQRFTEPGRRSENPRVDGSIPPPGTNQINSLEPPLSVKVHDFWRLCTFCAHSYSDALGSSPHLGVLPVNVSVPRDGRVGMSEELRNGSRRRCLLRGARSHRRAAGHDGLYGARQHSCRRCEGSG